MCKPNCVVPMPKPVEASSTPERTATGCGSTHAKPRKTISIYAHPAYMPRRPSFRSLQEAAANADAPASPCTPSLCEASKPAPESPPSTPALEALREAQPETAAEPATSVAPAIDIDPSLPAVLLPPASTPYRRRRFNITVERLVVPPACPSRVAAPRSAAEPHHVALPAGHARHISSPVAMERGAYFVEGQTSPVSSVLAGKPAARRDTQFADDAICSYMMSGAHCVQHCASCNAPNLCKHGMHNSSYFNVS